MRRLITLLATALPLTAAAGCGDDAVPSTLPPVECPAPPAATDPCAGRTCFEACGTTIALDDAPVASGLGLATAPELRPHTANRIGQALVTVSALGAQVRHGETGALLGATPLGGPALTVGDAGGLAFIGAGDGLIYPYVVNDPAHPVVLATWRATDTVHVVTADNPRLILRTPGGLSLVDVTDPNAPTEAHCFAVPATGGMAQVWDVVATSNFVVAAGGTTPRAFVYDLLRPTQPPTPLPIDAGTPVALYKGTLLVTAGGRLVEYALVPGQPATEVRRVDRPAGGATKTPLIGGFVLFDAVALDLDAALQPYDVIDDGGIGCTISLNAQDQSASYFLAPGIVPDRRFALADLPALECGPRASRFEGAHAVAAEPGGERFLVGVDAGLVVHDPVTGDRVDGVQLTGTPAWVGAHLAALTLRGTATDGQPYGFTVATAPEDDPTATPTAYDHATRLVGWAAADDALYLLVEAAGRAYGSDAPAAKTHQLLRFDPATGAPTPVTLPAKVAPEAIAAGGGHLWLLDAGREAIALDLAGAELSRAELPLGFDPTVRPIASELGLFFTDACGGLNLVTPEGELATTTTPWRALAADADHLYAVAPDAPHAALATAARFAALAPAAGADGALGLTVGASWPAPTLDAAAAAGSRLALAAYHLYVFEAE